MFEKMRNVLLIEPNYHNKYPPIGLMKLATYHRMVGDNVVFFKGNIKDLILDVTVELCIQKLNKIDNSINWNKKTYYLREFIKNRKNNIILNIGISNSRYEILLFNSIIYYKDYYWKKLFLKEPYWDRICVSTLFTFYWEITIETIESCKQLVKDLNEIWVGGPMASVLSDELRIATGLKNIHIGLLNSPGLLDANDIVIDNLPLDYSILDEIDYKYPEKEAYYGYTTRGCIRKCEFCAVPIIEPKYCNYISISESIKEIINRFGEKRNLLLLDNNVLASPKFLLIIDEIKKLGFDKKTRFIEPNQLELVVRNFNNHINVNACKRRLKEIYEELLRKLKGKQRQEVYNLLYDNELLNGGVITIENVNNVHSIISPLYEKIRNKSPKNRYVDFNQGVDARLLTEEKARLLSEIPIRPLRIAFDSMKYKEYYLKAIENSIKYGIKYFSNYILYNYDDDPIELYQRLKINVELCDKYKIDIYSFPMKYHPIFGDYHRNRDFIGKHWNRKFIRAVQVILNATKGKIGKGMDFFLKAFGKDEAEFMKLLYMPETYLLYRLFFEKEGLAQSWWKTYSSLHPEELNVVNFVIHNNDFKNLSGIVSDERLLNVLNHYTISRKDIESTEGELVLLQKAFDKLENSYDATLQEVQD